MTDNPEDKWPEYLFGPQPDIHALGVVSLNYGNLENIFRIIFSFATHLSERQIRAIFEKLNNSARIAALEEIVEEEHFPTELKALVTHFLDGFKICANNRHAIMHSHFGGTHSSRGEYGIVLSKISKSGKQLIFFATTAALRQVADAMQDYINFGIDVLMALDRFNNSVKPGRMRWTEADTASLPQKPPPPSALDWQSPPDRQAAQPPPRSSPA